MKVRIVGCHGGVAPGYQTSCYMINNRFLIDCGSACSVLSPAEQSKIDDIFITHPHLDHVKDICFLIENTFSPDRSTLTLRSTPEILKDVHDHLLNDILWPDFSKIPLDPATKKMAVEFAPMTPHLTLEGVRVQAFKVNHPGNAVGYLLEDASGQVIFTGDSGPSPLTWQMANACTNLRAVFTEISFPNRMDGLAKASGHYTLAQLTQDLKSFQHADVPIYISHFKPLFFNELMDEFHRGAPSQLNLMHEDDRLDFS